MKEKKSRLSKIFIMFSSVIALFMCVALGGVSLSLYNRDVMDNYRESASTAVRLTADLVNGEDIKESIKRGELTGSLPRARDLMNSLKRNSVIAYIYLVYFPNENDQEDVRYVMYGLSDEERAQGYPDSAVNARGTNEYTPQLLEAFLKAQAEDSTQIETIVNQAQGLVDAPVITSYCTILDEAGEGVAVLGVDVFAEQVLSHTRTYLSYVVIFGILILVWGVLGYRQLSQRFVIRPIEDLARSARNFVKETKEVQSPSDITFEVIQVKQDTEIRDLAEELGMMMGSTKEYMINLRAMTAEKERIGAELNVATKIQANMLPKIFPSYPAQKEFSVYASMDPAKEVGGDFYDFFFIDDYHFAMVMGDVSGKGVPASLFMVIAKALIKNCAQSEHSYSPGQILTKVNTQLCENNDEELFVTVWLGILDIRNGKGMAANAGHEHPALSRGGKDFDLVVYRHSPAVASMDGLKFKEHPFQLFPGDLLFIYTDGVAEATNASNELYGTDRMLEALNGSKEREPKDILVSVRQSVDGFVKEAPQFDDLTMLCYKYYGGDQCQ